MNGMFAGTFAVDTFFLMSGFFMAYLFIKELDKRKGMSPLTVPLMYLHRYIRLTPLYAVVILVTSSLFVHLGSGPFWHGVAKFSDNCQKNWWANLLYINNMIDQDQ